MFEKSSLMIPHSHTLGTEFRENILVSVFNDLSNLHMLVLNNLFDSQVLSYALCP